MKNTDLDTILTKARLPEIPQDSLEMFPRRIVAGLKRNEPGAPAARHFLPRLAWAFGLVTCVFIAYVIGHSSGLRGSKDLATKESLTNLKLIHETMEMFPNRLRAIVQDERGCSLVLSEAENVPDSTPIYVHIRDGKQSASFVTFSGQEVQIAGRTLTVLSDAHGGIILTGTQFVWSSTGMASATSHLKVEARNLGMVAM